MYDYNLTTRSKDKNFLSFLKNIFFNLICWKSSFRWNLSKKGLIKRYLFIEIGLLHGEKELLAMGLGPLRGKQKRRRNRPRRPRVLRQERRELQHFSFSFGCVSSLGVRSSSWSISYGCHRRLINCCRFRNGANELVNILYTS